MTSKLVIPKISKANNQMKNLIGKKLTKTVKFMGEDVKVSKLTVSEVMAIQTKAKELEGGDDSSGFEVLKTVIKSAVEGASDLSDDDFVSFPMDELSKLSAEVMKFSGIGQDQGK